MFSRKMASLLMASLMLVTVSSQAGTFGARDCGGYGSGYKQFDGFGYDARRGHPSEFDAGPVGADKESWLKLFGQIPNYRQIGYYMMNEKANSYVMKSRDEVFRWHMGPMWYRGRLGKNEVKVFVVGQEGAQDENITNRAFTGSTGTRVQKFLNHLGIYESYLFLNTFVYTLGFFEIDGKSNRGQRIVDASYSIPQAAENYVSMEQVWESPIVQYRNDLFDNVVFQNPNSLKLIFAVGGGADESLTTWINARSGNLECTSYKLSRNNCDLTAFRAYFESKGVAIGELSALSVEHPGKAKQGALEAKQVMNSFNRAAGKARDIKLEADPQERGFANCNGGRLSSRLNKGFQYDYAPIPFRDFAFGTNWRNGHQGTTSNRNGADKISIFSEHGKYSDGKTFRLNQVVKFGGKWSPKIANDQLADADRGLVYGMKENEVAYEHPRYSDWGETSGDLDHVKQFDAGPSSQAKARALMDWPDFTEINNEAFISDPSFGFNGIYRGNTRNPEYVIIADQMSHTDMFSARALTGAGGQFLQTFLNKAGIEGKYLIIRSLPVDTLGISTADKVNLALGKDKAGKSAADTIKNILDELGSVKKVAVMGPVAEAIGAELAVTDVVMVQPKENFSHVGDWEKAAKNMGLSAGADDLKAMFVIPRSDLPYSSRWWMGTTGDSATRGEAKKSADAESVVGNYYQLEAPWWVDDKLDKADPRPLTDKEKEAADAALVSENRPK